MGARACDRSLSLHRAHKSNRTKVLLCCNPPRAVVAERADASITTLPNTTAECTFLHPYYFTTICGCTRRHLACVHTVHSSRALVVGCTALGGCKHGAGTGAEQQKPTPLTRRQCQRSPAQPPRVAPALLGACRGHSGAQGLGPGQGKASPTRAGEGQLPRPPFTSKNVQR
jgi:hypothetical protein